jgi:hypothetical protein
MLQLSKRRIKIKTCAEGSKIIRKMEVLLRYQNEINQSSGVDVSRTRLLNSHLLYDLFIL